MTNKLVKGCSISLAIKEIKSESGSDIILHLFNWVKIKMSDNALEKSLTLSPIVEHAINL